ncbi:mitochondrial 39-S ribosomal protein L47 (MRP-L47)-domain-containing protein [Absidia repens]|uniref:Large ribosomal subunit protein uL29m n=1 Tax=Absidia repens TaxID=90262 RepID=A0A1X2IM17_9FUNG|nr:mitochondrial 39-S ribosomal protein L47 (MRP-L47)-domain-containing protein [Absidia repens]
MSFFQRLNLRPLSTSISSRFFSTSRYVSSANTTTANATNTSTKSSPTGGLYQFFENGEALPKRNWTGRAWKASELRLKSFDDLHKLWYVLLKERNLLATQREEAKRLKVHRLVWTNAGRVKKCQQSMARIKFVLNERQRAYESALEQK